MMTNDELMWFQYEEMRYVKDKIARGEITIEEVVNYLMDNIQLADEPVDSITKEVKND